MEARPFEESLIDYLANKYPTESEAELQERFESINNRRLYLVKNSGKTCSSCSTFKTLSEYGVDSREQDGLHTTCKECRKSYTKEGT